MEVGIFFNSVNNIHKHPHKYSVLESFMKGVNFTDTTVEYHSKLFNLNRSLTAGVILGYTLDDTIRKHIITSLENNNIHRIFIDSNILNYANPNQKWHRFSLNSVYPTDGIYFFTDIDKTRWDTFSKDHGVTLKPWRTNGEHIVILCQRSNGWNLVGTNQMKWLRDTITNLRYYTDRKIVVRLHPGDKFKVALQQEIVKRYPFVTVSTHDNIVQDLQNCWCTIGYNSTPNVVSVIEGIPSIISDPAKSWANGVAGTSLSAVEKPPIPDREEWIHQIANIHWSNEDLATGKLWTHVREYINSAHT